MLNSELVTKYLKAIGEYPYISGQDSDGLVISAESGQLIISGSPCDLISVADLLVSLALSGENKGQHWHLDELTLISTDSSIDEFVIERND